MNYYSYIFWKYHYQLKSNITAMHFWKRFSPCKYFISAIFATNKDCPLIKKYGYFSLLWRFRDEWSYYYYKRNRLRQNVKGYRTQFTFSIFGFRNVLEIVSHGLRCRVIWKTTGSKWFLSNLFDWKRLIDWKIRSMIYSAYPV